MVDIFKLLGIEHREDKYTYCLLKMIELGNDDFKKKVGNEFGFESSDYRCIRRSFTGIDSDSRKQITPDFIIYNSRRIAVVESKMFSGEGYMQTADYGKNIDKIKAALDAPSAEVDLYFLTLSGVQSENKAFKTVKWNVFYENILQDTVFDDGCLEVIRKTILEQARKYRIFENAIYEKTYKEMFSSDQYWVSPFSLLSSGQYDKTWQEASGTEPFNIYNFDVTGHGHSEFITDLYKEKWRKEGTGQFDNIHLFIRIEWYSEYPIVWLGWEYYDRNTENRTYVKIKKVENKSLKESMIQSLIDYKQTWIKSNTPYSIKTTPKKEDSIKALKCELACENKTISEIIEDIKNIIAYYSKEIDSILSAFLIKGKYLSFDKETYEANIISHK
ncbi:MAG: hypothetical protein E7477_09040 [Ruminococcaceae bacterium]|nr:hypothetical protein [Oscillospiraceae bacterium]